MPQGFLLEWVHPRITYSSSYSNEGLKGGIGDTKITSYSSSLSGVARLLWDIMNFRYDYSCLSGALIF